MMNLVNYSDDESSGSDYNESNDNKSIKSPVQTSKKSKKIELMKPSSKANNISTAEEDNIATKVEQESKDFNSEIDLNSLDEADKIKLKMRKALEPYPYPNCDSFKIPASSSKPVDPIIQQKVDHFYKLKAEGMLFNNNIMKMKSFRNPNIYHKFVDYLGLEEVGTNFTNENIFPKQGFYDQISRWQNDLEEEKINRNKNSKVNMSRNSTYLTDKFQSSGSTSASGGTGHGHKRRRWDQRH